MFRFKAFGAVVAYAIAVAACGGSVQNDHGVGGAGVGGDGAGGVGAGGIGAGGTGFAGADAGPVAHVDKLDLLLMVDNSISMAGKQLILGHAIPALVSRLVSPKVDPATGMPEFNPVVDMHIGLITSSLGGHGGDQCAPDGPGWTPEQNDRAHLLPSVRSGLPSYQDLGFLWWDPTGTKAQPPGQSANQQLVYDFQAWLGPGGVGEFGCGFEAQLESWYRFLIDPTPYQTIAVENNLAQPQGVDDVVLTQRKDFLRPDSAVVILMLTDENDCSFVDGGYDWIAAQGSNPNGTPYHLPRATAVCDQDPNSSCCQSCAEPSANAGCPPLANDPNCQQGIWDDIGDPTNLRCWQQKRRFGIDFLYPTRRYVEALTQPTICPNWDGDGPVDCPLEARVPNPLMTLVAGQTRDPRLVFLAGIVGVPWQDLASDDTLNDPNQLRYLTAGELAAKKRWDWLAPQCEKLVSAKDLPRPGPICALWNEKDAPDDPLMIESPQPRMGVNPAIGAALVDPSGPELANPINGHEWNTSLNDLEFACIFTLPTPKNCALVQGGCDCKDPSSEAQSPLCQSGGSYGAMQYYAKAYPGLRELEVMKDLGPNGIPSSICPKVTSGDPSAPVYGYNPAVDAVVAALRGVLL